MINNSIISYDKQKSSIAAISLLYCSYKATEVPSPLLRKTKNQTVSLVLRLLRPPSQKACAAAISEVGAGLQTTQVALANKHTITFVRLHPL